MARVFWTNHRARLCKTKVILDIFVHSLENRSSIGDEQLISMEYSRIEGDSQTFSNTSLDGAVLRQIYAKEQVTYRYHLPIIVETWRFMVVFVKTSGNDERN